MRRREFLNAIPPWWRGGVLDPDTATEAELDEVWKQFVAEPITFEVSEAGELSVAGMRAPQSRGQWIALTITDHPTIAEILELTAQFWGAHLVVAQVYLEAIDDEEGDPELVTSQVLQDWLNEGDENVQSAGDRLREWLADDELFEDDYTEAERQGTTPHAAALSFWRDGKLGKKQFGVLIIDGQSPGNDYCAARLRLPIGEANARALMRGVPIRFLQAEPETNG